MTLTRLRMDELVNAWVSDDTTPFQVALLAVFSGGPFLRPDGSVDVVRISAELAARARHVAPLRRRVVWTRFGQGRPVWAEDPHFDATAHIGTATLPPATDLPGWAANRILRPLDPDRPLWRAEVIDGLPDGRFALLIVVHHIVADGITGMTIAGSLLDTAPDAVVPPAPNRPVPPLPTGLDLIRDRTHVTWQTLRTAWPPHPLRFATRAAEQVRRVREAAALVSTTAPGTSLPRHIGPGRRLAVVGQPLEDLHRTGHALGVTLNDLLLEAVTGGLRTLFTSRGDDVEGLVLRASVPAATGQPGQVNGVLLAELPVGEPDRLRRLALINRTTTTRKEQIRAGATGLSDVLRMPRPLARLGMGWMRRFGSRRVNLFVSNVPGPGTPLWLAGARLHQAVPVPPLVQGVPLGIGALSYAGTFWMSVHTDAAVEDVHVLADAMRAEFEALRTAARFGHSLPDLRPRAALTAAS